LELRSSLPAPLIGPAGLGGVYLNPNKPEPTGYGNGDDARFVQWLRHPVFLHYRYPKDV